MSTEIIQRWDGFLGKLRQRFDEVLAEARAGCAMLLEQADDDPTPMSNAWGAVRVRVIELQKKLDDTWNDQVDDRLSAADVPGSVIDRERDKGIALREWMDLELERQRRTTFADAARRIWARAERERPAEISCGRCGFRFPPPPSWRTVDVMCGHCRSSVTFEAGTWAGMVIHFCAHAFAEEHTLAAFEAMIAAETSLRHARGAPVPLLQAYEGAQIAHWQAYFHAVAHILPERAPTLERDVYSRMRHWYDQMRREKSWIDARCQPLLAEPGP